MYIYTGVSVTISVTLTIVNGDGDDTEVLTSAAQYFVGYAPPVISGIYHEACQTTSDSSSLTDCPRTGGGDLVISGTNLGNT